MLGQLMSTVLRTIHNPTAFSMRMYKTRFKPGGGWSDLPQRDRTYNRFPRPNETKRVKKHGWNTRMSTLSGRKVIMNRILKGCAMLSH